jgi:hypothetical protein
MVQLSAGDEKLMPALKINILRAMADSIPVIYFSPITRPQIPSQCWNFRTIYGG